MHARIQIYWCRSSIFRQLKLELLTQFPASNDEKYINVVYIWRKFVSFYGYVHWRMTTEISVMYGSEKVKGRPRSQKLNQPAQRLAHMYTAPQSLMATWKSVTNNFLNRCCKETLICSGLLTITLDKDQYTWCISTFILDYSTVTWLDNNADISSNKNI